MPTAAQSVRGRAIDAVARTIRELALPGLDDRVYVRQGRRTGATEEYPCVEIRRGPRPDTLGGTFRVILPVYAFQVLFKLRDALAPDADFDRVDLWVQAVTDLFDGQELDDVAEVWQVVVEPLPPADENKEEYQLAVAGVTLLVFTHSLTAVRT